MKKSVIGPDFEKKDAVPPYSESKQALKLKRRVSFTVMLSDCLLKFCHLDHVSFVESILMTWTAPAHKKHKHVVIINTVLMH